VKDTRLHELQALLWQQQTAFNQSKVGQTVDVLFDKAGRKPGQIMGKSPWLQSVHVMAPERLIGHIMPVRITAATQNSLTGEVAIAAAA
jgi:tRNA-2-methylthio-N6-dimethylallyladenosine synthase